MQDVRHLVRVVLVHLAAHCLDIELLGHFAFVRHKKAALVSVSPYFEAMIFLKRNIVVEIVAT